MKVLFVSSGNKKDLISSVVHDQGESLKRQGVDLSYFTIVGKGIWGYLKNVITLSRYLKKNEFDIVHAHYSLSGFVAALAGAKQLVVSLMGSDVKQNILWRVVIRVFEHLFWDACIVKTSDMQKSLGSGNLHVIPNGVDLELFCAIRREEALEHLGWDEKKKHFLFASDPDRKVKNFNLAQNAYSLISGEYTELHYLKNVPKNEMPYYYSSADVVMLTSFREGSPNVIKEAMACGRPIVATDAGDIGWLLDKTEGCYLTHFDRADCAEKLKTALGYSNLHESTKGRERIIELGLDSGTVSEKIVNIYVNVIDQKL